jgi:hypothetical protein
MTMPGLLIGSSSRDIHLTYNYLSGNSSSTRLSGYSRAAGNFYLGNYVSLPTSSNLFVDAGSPTNPVVVHVTVNSGSYIGGPGSGFSAHYGIVADEYFAFCVAGFPSGSTINLYNYGTILGGSGAGGVGGIYAFNLNPYLPNYGCPGGSAIYVQSGVTLNIYNYGTISAGAGGGYGQPVTAAAQGHAPVVGDYYVCGSGYGFDASTTFAPISAGVGIYSGSNFDGQNSSYIQISNGSNTPGNAGYDLVYGTTTNLGKSVDFWPSNGTATPGLVAPGGNSIKGVANVAIIVTGTILGPQL